MSPKPTRGLGRGLDALLGDVPAPRRDTSEATGVPIAADAPLGAMGRRLMTLPIEFLKPNPTQPRRHFNDDAIEELAELDPRAGPVAADPGASARL